MCFGRWCEICGNLKSHLHLQNVNTRRDIFLKFICLALVASHTLPVCLFNLFPWYSPLGRLKHQLSGCKNVQDCFIKLSMCANSKKAHFSLGGSDFSFFLLLSFFTGLPWVGCFGSVLIWWNRLLRMHFKSRTKILSFSFQSKYTSYTVI